MLFPPQVSASFQKKVQNKIKDLLQQMEEGLKTADPHDFSTYTGWTGLSPSVLTVKTAIPCVMLSTSSDPQVTAKPQHYCIYSLSTTGIALLYLQLHRVTHETSHLQRALDYVKRSMRILNGRKVTFLCGDAGPLAVGAVVHHKLNNTADSKDCLSR